MHNFQTVTLEEIVAVTYRELDFGTNVAIAAAIAVAAARWTETDTELYGTVAEEIVKRIAAEGKPCLKSK